MAEDIKSTLNEFNEGLEKVEENIKNLVEKLELDFRTSLTKSIAEAKKLGNSFEKSTDVTKKLNTQLFDLGVKNEKLSLKEISLRKQLERAMKNKNEALQNSLATQIRETVIQRNLNEQVETQLRLLEKINEERKKQNNLSEVLKKKFQEFSKPFKELFTVAGIFKTLTDSALRFNKVSVDLGKNLGYGADNANRTTKGLVKAAQTSDNLNVTLQNTFEAANELSAATGFVAEYSADALTTQILLTKQFGLTADEAAGIFKFSVLTGKSSKAVNDAMVGTFVATRNSLRAGVPFKAAIAEASKVSGVLASNLQNNPEQIVKAVVQAKALGTSLEQTAKQGRSLLEFPSSIENELKAELLTSRELNLERARAAALTGDQITLTQELAKNIGSIEEFDRMNVLQKDAIAQAVGLTADELANQLRNQKIALETGKSLVQITKDEALEAQKRQDIQTKFNQAFLKLQDLIGNLVAGPMGAFIDGLSTALDIVGKIFGKFGSFVELIKGFLPGGISKAIGGMASVVTIGALTTVIARSLLKGTLLNPMITKDISAIGAGGGSLTDMIFGKKAGGQFKKGGGRVPKGGRTGGFLKGAGGKSLLGILGGVGLNYASEAAAEAGNEGLAKGLSVGSGILSGAGTGALIGSIIPGIGTAVGGIAGGIIGGLGSLLADDIIGYGARTLVTPQGAIALNNRDTIVAGTNLFKGDDVISMPKGSLNLGADMSVVVNSLKEVRDTVAKLVDRPVNINMDGKKVGSNLVQGSYKSA